MTAEALIVQGDALDVLRALPDESIACCVTSPPYWGLRNYGVAGQIGLETTPDEYVARLVAVFSEVHRVLADDGTLWLNLGDSYASTSGLKVSGPQQSRDGRRGVLGPRSLHPSASRTVLSAFKDFGDLKPKDLVGIPWRVAFALQSAGWYLRADIIWAKGFSGDTRAGSCMPESVRDRPTKAHEYVFLMTKSPRYWYDVDAVREARLHPAQARAYDTAKNEGRAQDYSRSSGRNDGSLHVVGVGFKSDPDAGANLRSVWHFNPRPSRCAHFAMMPITLASLCVRAGCKSGGVVLDPFTGAGTTALAALQQGRDFIGAELNPEYVAIARARIAEAQP